MVGLSSKYGYYYPSVRVVCVKDNNANVVTKSKFNVDKNSDIYFYIDFKITTEEYINKLLFNFTFDLENPSDKLDFKVFPNYGKESETDFDNVDKGTIVSPDFSVDLVEGYNKISLDISQFVMKNITISDQQFRIRAKLRGEYPASSGTMNVTPDVITGTFGSYTGFIYGNKLTDNLSYLLNLKRNTFVLNLLGVNCKPLNINLNTTSALIFDDKLTFNKQTIFERKINYLKIEDEEEKNQKFYVYDHTNHPFIYHFISGYIYRCFDNNSYIVDDPDEDFKIVFNGEEYFIDRETDNIVQIIKKDKTLYYAYDGDNLLTKVFYNNTNETSSEKKCVQFTYTNSQITEMYFDEEKKKIQIEYDSGNKISKYYVKNTNSSNEEAIALKIEFRYEGTKLAYIIVNDYINYAFQYNSTGLTISQVTSITTPSVISSISIKKDTNYVQMIDNHNNSTKYYLDSNQNNIYTFGSYIINTQTEQIPITIKQCNVNNANNIKQPKNIFLNNLYEDVNFSKVTNSTYYSVTNKQDNDGVVNNGKAYSELNSNEYHFCSTQNLIERTIETSLGASGKANEALSVTALARTNLNPTEYLKVQLKFKYKVKYDYEYKTYEFYFNSNDGTEQFNGMNVLSKYDYDDITLIIKYKGKQESFISNIFVNKVQSKPEIIYDENGKVCGYTNENQMYISKSEFTASPETIKNEVYNSGQTIKKTYRNGLITKEENLITGDKVVYTYNDNNDLINKTSTFDKYTNTETYEYDENNKLSMSSYNDQKTFYLDKQNLNKKINHVIDPDGLFSRTVEIKQSINKDVVHQTKQLNELIEKNDFYYENGLLKTIKTKDQDMYKFEYDNLNRIKKIYFNNVLYIEYDYSTNDLVTRKKYSNTNNIDFSYDLCNRLSTISYNNGSTTTILATYIYDEYNRIIETDNSDGYSHIYQYDNDNNIIKDTQVNHSIEYNYNNKGEINNTKYNLNGEICNNNINVYDSSKSKFLEKISSEVYCDYLLFDNSQSLYTNIENNAYSECDDVLKSNVTYLFNSQHNLYVEDLLRLEKNNDIVYNNQIFNTSTYNEKIKDCYNVLAFIKVENPFTVTTPIMKFEKYVYETENGYKNQYKYYLKVSISSSNEVIVNLEKELHYTANSSLTTGQITTLYTKRTGKYININKWNIVGYSNQSTSQKGLVFINDSVVETAMTYQIEYDNFRVLGNDTNPIKLIYLSCGYRIIDQTKLSIMYNEFNSIFNDNKNEKISLITDYDYFNSYELDKVSFNNTFKTYKGITPNILYTKDEYESDSERFFIYDEEINKYCYLSDKNRNSFLSYELPGNTNSLIVSSYFKLFKENTLSHNTLFTICDKQTNSELIKITYKHPRMYLYINGLSVTSKIINFEYNKFNYFKFKKQSNVITITVNDEEFTYNTALTIPNINLIVGNDNNNFAFDGLFSDMVFGYTYSDTNDYKYQNTQFVSTSDKYGRITSKQIKPKNNSSIIETKYSYYDETDENDKTILKQTINRIKKYDGSEEIISYDENYNIIKRVIIEDNYITNVINYEYDDFRRLKKETRHTITSNNIVDENYKASFEYDHSGNITRKTIYEEGNLLKDLYFTYSSDNTNRLISVYDDCEVITKTITYNNSLYPSSYNNKNITYRGKQIVKIGDVTFEYDSLGNRISKNYDGTNTSYYYDGNKLIRQENKDEGIIDYIYTNNVLEGLKYDNEEYYYIRDITGSIEKIIDKNKTVMVVYSYTSYGEVTKNINTSLTGTQREIAQILLNNNGFVYKGYYYDVETNLFLVSSRYYSPELCRWISPDDIEYLDPESVNGLNLYCYCFNDPINYIDPDGHFPILALVLTGIALVGMGLTGIGVATDNNVLTAVGLGMVGAAALVSGIGALASGVLFTGVVGGITTAAGVGSLTFMSAEITEAAGAGNWIQDVTGWSDSTYNTILLSTAAVATLGTAASSFASYYKVSGIRKYDNYLGIKFQNSAGKTRVMSFHTHGHNGVKGLKSIKEWHWQLKKWDPRNLKTGGTVGRWAVWGLKKIIF